MTPRKAFDDQKRHSESRNIPWELSYEDWLEMWLVSGQYHNRGRGNGKYHMCRHGDVGPYSKKNCYIAKAEENQQQMWSDRRKVLPKQYEEIYKKYTTTDMTQYEVADYYGVGQSYVSKVVKKVRKNLVEVS